MNVTIYSIIDSPLGRLMVRGDGRLVTGLFLPNHKNHEQPEASWRRDDAPFAALRRQLAEYFAGERRDFDVPIKLLGTRFQQRVWQELTRIPYGKTLTYAQLAQRVGRPHACRAVGQANSRNPVSIVVPCHRIVGADGKLTGYAGGVHRKRWLLDRERQAALAAQPISSSSRSTAMLILSAVS